ncbi:hypothetical protein MHYP_G00206400 [Metynnis hypsauchen]
MRKQHTENRYPHFLPTAEATERERERRSESLAEKPRARVWAVQRKASERNEGSYFAPFCWLVVHSKIDCW